METIERSEFTYGAGVEFIVLEEVLTSFNIDTLSLEGVIINHCEPVDRDVLVLHQVLVVLISTVLSDYRAVCEIFLQILHLGRIHSIQDVEPCCAHQACVLIAVRLLSLIWPVESEVCRFTG